MTQHNGHYRTLLWGLSRGIPPNNPRAWIVPSRRPTGETPMMTLAAAALIFALADDKEALVQAAARTAALESYAFKSEHEFQTSLGNAPAQVPSMDGKYQKDAGLHIKSDRGEYFRKGDRT